jgi:protein-L-isoaspartate(D-aspartate) O-methyltransferase
MTEHNFEQMRRAMVASQLRTTGVSDPRVLAAMGAVPRERFVPADRASTAYAEAAIPLGEGRSLSAPMALGKLLSEADPMPGDRALVVGAGTGYAAAVLARLVGSVFAIEENPALLKKARSLLGSEAVELVKGDLVKGCKKHAPYDLILIDGAVEHLPDALIDQLADGGRLATGLIEHGVQRLAIGRRAGGAFGVNTFADAESAVLPGFAKPPAFRF